MYINNIRQNIDGIDRKIVTLIASRQAMMPSLAKFKKVKNMSLFQSEREKEIMKSKKQLAKSLDLDEELIEKIYRIKIKDARGIQKKVMRKMTKRVR